MDEQQLMSALLGRQQFGPATAPMADLLAAGVAGRSMFKMGNLTDPEVIQRARFDRRAGAEAALRVFYGTAGPGGGPEGRNPIMPRKNVTVPQRQALEQLGFGDLA